MTGRSRYNIPHKLSVVNAQSLKVQNYIRLLKAIKRTIALALTTPYDNADVIDLCTIDGTVKELNKNLKTNATRFFKMRELCLVVYVQC